MEAGRAQRHLPRLRPRLRHGARALEVFWSDGALEARTTALGERVGRVLTATARRHGLPAPRGRGLAWGLPSTVRARLARCATPPTGAAC
ncbi:diaminobutyrate-2-oxoglutarate aminotransferase [Streptomyces viridosporus ATCC 14672]|uniref:Diaminobutyrate-2-oxoglutarate aminotransferase n=1 Tax=Streptomyces viridosporus (strain ATCC 14672 / DSM 40746 / JCM 4963 / KCTC 9882 / NRRL B-12104 / FH 1290) TaxID=566461 RepID=D6A706_STRV1|nr:diaminobutyrate-2-oxoglutarate aminotransferase [Streptomyces viridosporus ATCC 14672]